jgi:hypothetical protein
MFCCGNLLSVSSNAFNQAFDTHDINVSTSVSTVKTLYMVSKQSVSTSRKVPLHDNLKKLIEANHKLSLKKYL